MRKMEQSTTPRLMMYSQDGFGLGHMRRTTAIANELLRIRPEACVLTLADSRLGQFFESGARHDYIKLPSIMKAGPGDWRPVGLPLPFADVQSMRCDIIKSALLNFQPHVLLVDHMPHGAMGELIPALEALRAGGINTRIVLGLRDILDAPDVVRERWAAEGAYDAVERYYDSVLVYGKHDIYNLAEQYGFSPAVVERMHYCGYVCTPEAPRYANRVRGQNLPSGSPAAKLIVAMAGGGADGYPMMRALLDAFPAILERQRCGLVLIAGPFMPVAQRRDLEARARGLPCRVRVSVSDTLSYMAAADLVVTMAGYNTTTEALRIGTPTILIPRAGPSAEQRTRARLFSAKGWLDVIDPDELAVEVIAERTCEILSRSRRGAAPEPQVLQGLSVAAEYLSAMMPAESYDLLPQDPDRVLWSPLEDALLPAA